MFSRPFASDTSPKQTDREGLGKRSTGTGQGHNLLAFSFRRFWCSSKYRSKAFCVATKIVYLDQYVKQAFVLMKWNNNEFEYISQSCSSPKTPLSVNRRKRGFNGFSFFARAIVGWSLTWLHIYTSDKVLFKRWTYRHEKYELLEYKC